MNNDLISRKALLGKECCGRISGDDVRNAPAIDAEPVRHGRWEKAKAAFHKKCSNCKCIFHMPRERNYCPNCGAKMQGGSNDYADMRHLWETACPM